MVLAISQMRAAPSVWIRNRDDRRQKNDHPIQDVSYEQEISQCCKPQQIPLIMTQKERSDGCFWKSSLLLKKNVLLGIFEGVHGP